MRVSLSIDCDGDAFYVADPEHEIVRILRSLADRIEHAPTADQLDGEAIVDVNGNTVGKLSVKLATEPAPPPADTVAVRVARADVVTLADALARAIDADERDANAEGWHDDDTRAHFAESVRALDRLERAIHTANGQE